MEKKKAAVAKPKEDERDQEITKLTKRIHLQDKEIVDLQGRIALWREFGRQYGPVSSVEKLNQILIKLKSVGEI